MPLFNQSQFNTSLWNSVNGPAPPPTSPRTIAESSLLGYIRRYLNDPNGVIWTDAYLTQLIAQAEVWISDVINLDWIRFAIPIQIGIGLYDMSILGPAPVKNITRITYRGFKV